MTMAKAVVAWTVAVSAIGPSAYGGDAPANAQVHQGWDEFTDEKLLSVWIDDGYETGRQGDRGKLIFRCEFGLRQPAMLGLPVRVTVWPTFGERHWTNVVVEYRFDRDPPSTGDWYPTVADKPWRMVSPMPPGIERRHRESVLTAEDVLSLRRSTNFYDMALQSSRVIVRVGGQGRETLRFDLAAAHMALVAFSRACRESEAPGRTATSPPS